MNTINEQLFEPIPHVKVPDKKYKRVEFLPEVCEKLSRMTNQSVCVVDYSKRNFFYVSPHPLFLCGYTPQEVKEMGYSFFEKVLSPKDLQMVLELNKCAWELFHTLVPAERTNACFAYDVCLHHKNGLQFLVNRKLSPAFLTEQGDVWLAISTVTLSSKKTSGNVVFTQNDISEYYSYDFAKKKIVEYKFQKLTKREREIYALLIRGFDTKEIAQTLQTSTLTVQSHCKNIRKLLKASSIASAVTMYYNSKF